MTPANTFETHIGRFYGLGMLRLCRSDNIGLRDIMPTMMLRLDLDQEYYDFVKWWATCGPDGHYDWGDMTLPHLDIHGADAFEDIDFLEQYSALNHIIAILLLKLKLLVDIRHLKITHKILALRHVPESSESLLRTEAKLLNQARQLSDALIRANDSFMYYLFDPDEALCARPEAYTFGSWEEMALAMQNSYAAWWETEGVLDLLNEARASAARASGRDIDITTAQKSDSREAEEMLVDISVNRIWQHLDDVVENASYLGP
ncbi:MYND-type zinc finger protein samB [Fusarium falciforme]|uniref:MYND-type zinc finger protein samB n=1 Tax=Fusarium falciforme TaxID=195108 RepID=UPI0022FFCD60|nr:MYND-type zinc finger protein samB [Fusarium falciforme]WAO86053.1 MYND-type zinc finger protein samB [Fusarium falciforme]